MVSSFDATNVTAWRSERRTAARHHHPDVGGDTQEYLCVIAAIDARYGLGAAASEVGALGCAGGRASLRTDRLTRARRRARRAFRRARQLSRRVRARLPRRVPGSRRYTQL